MRPPCFFSNGESRNKDIRNSRTKNPKNQILKYIITISLFIISSCNDDKIERLEKDVKEIKQSFARIEALLGGQGSGNIIPGQENLSTSQSLYSSSTKKKSYANGRCQAITKKGTQCSRAARSGGYCWQHGG
jgi:hypothetical protein